MPDDLKYLSVAESALYQSTSRAGAVGFWQFMKGTAREYGLHVSDYVDERRNPEKSTYAAMKYLKDAYKRSGSWTLAAAGYNMGMGGVNKAMNYHIDAEDYYDLYLNSETSRYVFRIVIIKDIMKYPEKYGFIIDENELYKPYKTKKVVWDSSIDNLAVWASQRGTSYKDVKILNPWILKRSLRPPLSGKKYEILIPEDAGE
jgi:membrane-bound lytic murein transglycosylase D